ncbi:MAG: hypothetical protein M0R77_08060 [Gammaproteobacteria bacterium]|nr:hypothetical protein [Gammaproteobacteria bacterium]
MAILGTYSPEDVTVLFGGVHQLSGFIDGTFISISKDEPSFSTRVSADGAPTRTFSSNPLYTVQLVLHSGSESNQVLSYALTVDEITKMGKFPLIIKDQLGSSLFFSLTSWIESKPDSDFSVSIEEREWTIKCSQVTFNVGGNDSPSSLGEDVLRTGLGLAGTFL